MTIRFINAAEEASRILQIRKAAFDGEPNTLYGTEPGLVELLRDPLTAGIVAPARNGRLLGYALYRIHTDELEILELAVHPEHQRCKYGTALLQWIIQRCKGRSLVAVTRDSWLPAHLFLKANGMKAVRITRSHEEVLYHFEIPATLEAPF